MLHFNGTNRAEIKRTDIYAVGRAAVLHFSGVAWVNVQSALSGSYSAVSGSDSNDVYVVRADGGISLRRRQLVEHRHQAAQRRLGDAARHLSDSALR